MSLKGAEKTVAIIGNGCAAVECIRAMRKEGYAANIHVFSESGLPVYNPMLTTYYAAGKIGYNDLFPYGSNHEVYEKLDAHLHEKEKVVSLCAEAMRLETDSGMSMEFDQCLIASGASPFIPPIPGAKSPQVLTMRTVNDALRLEEVLEKKPRKALVIGASMVGVKVMEVFHKAGVQVCLADLADSIFPLAAYPDCAQFIEDRLTNDGIQLYFGASLSSVKETENGLLAYLGDDTEPLQADVIVICIGVRPNLGFVNREQIEVKQGVLVDSHMRSSAPGIYAAGDVAQGMNLMSGQQQIIGLWASARQQGRTAGLNMAGACNEYFGGIPHNITHFMGMDFVSIGDVKEYTRTEKLIDTKRYLQLFWQDERLSGANFVDEYSESGVVKNAIIKALMPDTQISDSKVAPVLQYQYLRDIIKEVESV